MARPKSDDKRNALLAAATRVIATHGLVAATAVIAQEAGVSNGSLFTYFATKADLLNQLYVELKAEMGAGAVEGLPSQASDKEQLRSLWNRWLRWAVVSPEKRKALAQLGVSDDITQESHIAASRSMAAVATLLERCRARGPMKGVPLGFLTALMSALAETTIDFILQHPEGAEEHTREGFEALWRMME